MTYTWYMHGTCTLLMAQTLCIYSPKKGERFLFPHELSLEQLPILQLNNDDKRKHHRTLENLYCTMNKCDLV